MKVYDDYKNQYEPLSEKMDANFAIYTLQKYGIEILFDSNRHVLPAYNIKNHRKHMLFVLKYGDVIGELQ